MTFQVKPGQQRLLSPATVIRPPVVSGSSVPTSGLFGKTAIISPISGAEEAAAKSSVGSRVRSEERASRSLSILANSLTLKEDAVQKRSSTLSELQQLASRIKNESDPNKASILRDEASTLISAQTESDSQAAADDENVGEAVSATIRTQAFDDSSSEGIVSVSLSRTTSLSDLGVTSSLSFSSEDIDATISTLASAQEQVAIERSSLEGSRAGLESAVNEAGSKAASSARAAGIESPERFASRIASTITLARSGVVESGISALPVDSLLTSPESESGSSESLE